MSSPIKSVYLLHNNVIYTANNDLMSFTMKCHLYCQVTKTEGYPLPNNVIYTVNNNVNVLYTEMSFLELSNENRVTSFTK